MPWLLESTTSAFLPWLGGGSVAIASLRGAVPCSPPRFAGYSSTSFVCFAASAAALISLGRAGEGGDEAGSCAAAENAAYVIRKACRRKALQEVVGLEGVLENCSWLQACIEHREDRPAVAGHLVLEMVNEKSGLMGQGGA